MSTALNSIDDAIEATKELLLPFEVSRWLRLAVIVFFLSGVGGGLNVPFNGTGSFGDGGGQGPGGAPPVQSVTDALSGNIVLVLVAVVLFFVVLGLVFALLGGIMEFAFVESLRREEVHVRRYVRRFAWRGVRLFLFRIGVWVLGLLVFLLVGGGLVAALFGTSPSAWGASQFIGALLLLLPLFFLWLVVVGIVNGFTSVFVVPVMITEDRGTVLGGWRRFWPTLQGNLKEFSLYVLMSFLLGIGVGIATGTLTLIAVLVLLIPFGILGFGVFVLGGSSFSLPVLAGFGLLGVLAFLLFLLLTALIKVPFQAFLRYYALMVLGDVNPDFDLIPDLRERVRQPDGGQQGPPGGGPPGGPGGGPPDGRPPSGQRGQPPGGQGGEPPGGSGEGQPGPRSGQGNSRQGPSGGPAEESRDDEWRR
jgi:hypothetical protein